MEVYFDMLNNMQGLRWHPIKRIKIFLHKADVIKEIWIFSLPYIKNSYSTHMWCDHVGLLIYFNLNFTVSSHLQSSGISARSTFFQFTVNNLGSIVLLKYLKQIEIPRVKTFCFRFKGISERAYFRLQILLLSQSYRVSIHETQHFIHIENEFNCETAKEGRRRKSRASFGKKNFCIFHNIIFYRHDTIRTLDMSRTLKTAHMASGADLHSSVCFLSKLSRFLVHNLIKIYLTRVSARSSS